MCLMPVPTRRLKKHLAANRSKVFQCASCGDELVACNRFVRDLHACRNANLHSKSWKPRVKVKTRRDD